MNSQYIVLLDQDKNKLISLDYAIGEMVYLGDDIDKGIDIWKKN